MTPLLKQSAVDYKGGCCLFCGLSHPLSALEFHHINPQDKIQNISKFSCWSQGLINELDKCALLCCICHRKVHAGLIDHELFILLED